MVKLGRGGEAAAGTGGEAAAVEGSSWRGPSWRGAAGGAGGVQLGGEQLEELEGSSLRVLGSHAAECHKLPFTDALHRRHQVIWLYSKFLRVEPSQTKQHPLIYLLVAIIV